MIRTFVKRTFSDFVQFRLDPDFPSDLAYRSIGFTGTREGMTDYQKTTVASLLSIFFPSLSHHGDCIGADADFDKICKSYDFTTHGHPGCDSRGGTPHRAFCKTDLVEHIKPYLDRNRDIVDISESLIACPSGEEKLRSGTWSTIRYARSTHKPRFIVMPDGSIIYEREEK